MKIYTRTGDSGDTALFDGTRVLKSDPRVAAYGDLDVTMRIITDPDAKLPDEIVRRITLPRPAPPAEDRRDEDRSTGLDRAEQAREQGRQFGQDVADSARDHAEEARRNANPPGRPDPGAPPEPVGQPASPPAPGPGG